MFFLGPTNRWPELEPEARQLQSRIRRAFDELVDLITTLIRDLPDSSMKEVESAVKSVREIIERKRTFYRTHDQALKSVETALSIILAPVEDLYDSSDGISIYVPDTNALLFNIDLDRWTFGEEFTLLLVPTVLVELDALKVSHRNPDVMKKADGLITRIKGYRDRGGGDLRTGVTLRKGTSTLRSIAPEPNMAESLPWLDSSSNDDRILASFLEVMRAHARSPVTLVTRDLNMQNKAAHATIPYVEPPPP